MNDEFEFCVVGDVGLMLHGDRPDKKTGVPEIVGQSCAVVVNVVNVSSAGSCELVTTRGH